RGVRPGGPGESRLPRPHRSERGDVRTARARVRLPLVRDPLVPEPRVRRGRPRGRGADPGARADARHRRDAGAARSRSAHGALLGTRQALPGARGGARARRPAPRRAAVRAARARADAPHRHRPAHRDHPWGRAHVALRARGLAVSQPALPTVTVTLMPGAAATPARGFCSTTRPGRPFPRCSVTWSRSFASFLLARFHDSPITFGTVPWSGFASTTVTLSNDESVPVLGNWRSTTFTRWPASAGL